LPSKSPLKPVCEISLSTRFSFVSSESPVPDPEKAQTTAEFIDQLRRLKAWSGLTYRQLERRASDRGDVLPHSTVATALSRESLPRVELVRALVRACGCDERTTGTWVAVRRRLATGPDRTQAARRTAPPPRLAGEERRPRTRQAGRLAPILLAALFAVNASSPTAGAPRSAAVTTPVPVPAAWWRFEEAGGATAFDSSGHGADAILGGTVRRTAVPGGHALEFDGGGHAATRRPVVRTDGPFTLTAWVRLDRTGDAGTVISQHQGARDPDVILLAYDAEQTDWAFMFPDRVKGWAMGDETVFGGLRPVTGRWSHLAGVFDPANRRVCLYVDARLEACRTRATITRGIGAMDIGRAMEEGEPLDGWHGAIDDVRVFAGALDLPQIREVAGHRV
jgi:Concanavalin A-like lectin/glucanases superfamily